MLGPGFVRAAMGSNPTLYLVQKRNDSVAIHFHITCTVFVQYTGQDFTKNMLQCPVLKNYIRETYGNAKILMREYQCWHLHAISGLNATEQLSMTEY